MQNATRSSFHGDEDVGDAECCREGLEEIARHVGLAVVANKSTPAQAFLGVADFLYANGTNTSYAWNGVNDPFE